MNEKLIMNSKISRIIILLTPFQVRQLFTVINQFNVKVDHSMILVAEIINKQDRERLSLIENSSLITIPKKEISFDLIKKNPIQGIRHHKGIIKELNKSIDHLHLDQLSIEQVIIGTEKDIFTQLIIKKLSLSNDQYELIAIEEGLGYFSKSNFKDRFKEVLYKILTPIFFGTQLTYHKKLGSLKRINTIYSRFVDSIPDPLKQTEYFEIKPESSAKELDYSSRRILFYSSPLSEDKHCSAKEEQVILNHIFRILHEAGYETTLKPHPREILKKYDDFMDSIELSDLSASGEEIDYFSYSAIIHFGSSLILDIYQRAYPLERVITMNMEYSVQPVTENLFELGKNVKLFSPTFVENLEKSISDL